MQCNADSLVTFCRKFEDSPREEIKSLRAFNRTTQLMTLPWYILQMTNHLIIFINAFVYKESRQSHQSQNQKM